MDVDTGLPTDLVAPSVSSPPARAPVQCAWAVCLYTREGLQYLYVDPCASHELATIAPKLRHRSLVDFVAPEERPRMLTQLRTMAQTRTLFGSVIRCRYASMEAIRAELHGWEPVNYVVTDLVVNRLGPHLALCFFHQVGADKTASVCGMPPGMLSLAEIHRLWHELYRAAPEAVKEPVSYVFQVLSTLSPRQLLFSWPPPTLYNACALAKLVQQATIKPQATCTERLHATHTLPVAGHMRSVESVLVPCGSIVLACFFVRPLNLDEARPAPRRASPVNEVEPAAPPIRAVAQAAPAPSLPSSTMLAPSSTPTASMPPQAQPVSIAPHDSYKEEAPAPLPVPTVTTTSLTKSCTSCGRSDSPEWRRGPSGHKTRRKRNKDGTTMTLKATGDPHHVPPSRGSGGGSRPGAHRRGKKERSASALDTSSMGSSDFDRRLASVLASMPHDARFGTRPSLAPVQGTPMGQVDTYATSASPSDLAAPLSIKSSPTSEVPMSAPLPIPTAAGLTATLPITAASHSLSPASIPSKGRSASTGCISPTSSTLLPNVLSYPVAMPVSTSPVSPTSPSGNNFSASTLPTVFPTSALPSMPVSPVPVAPPPSVVVSAQPTPLLPESAAPLKAATTTPMDSMAAAAALSALQAPSFPGLSPVATATTSPMVPTSPLSSIPTAEEPLLP